MHTSDVIWTYDSMNSMSIDVTCLIWMIKNRTQNNIFKKKSFSFTLPKDPAKYHSSIHWLSEEENTEREMKKTFSLQTFLHYEDFQFLLRYFSFCPILFVTLSKCWSVMTIDVNTAQTIDKNDNDSNVFILLSMEYFYKWKLVMGLNNNGCTW